MRNVSACITSSIHLGILQSQSVWTLATIRSSGDRAQAVGQVNPEGLDFGFHRHLVILMAEMEHLMDHLGFGGRMMALPSPKS